MILHDLQFLFLQSLAECSFHPHIVVCVHHQTSTHFISNDPENIIQVMFGTRSQSQINTNNQLSASEKVKSFGFAFFSPKATRLSHEKQLRRKFFKRSGVGVLSALRKTSPSAVFPHPCRWIRKLLRGSEHAELCCVHEQHRKEANDKLLSFNYFNYLADVSFPCCVWSYLCCFFLYPLLRGASPIRHQW